jgi:hypothetical protein
LDLTLFELVTINKIKFSDRKYAVGMVSCGMIYISIFMKTGTGVQAILRFYLRNLRGCNVGITDGRDLNYAVEMGSGAMIYMPSFIKIGSGIQKLIGGYTDSKVIP